MSRVILLSILTVVVGAVAVGAAGTHWLLAALGYLASAVVDHPGPDPVRTTEGNPPCTS